MHLDIVRPVHIATLAKRIYETGRHTTARRVLIEARDFFGEAMLAGFIHRNPAAAIKTPRIEVQRSRLTLDQFERIYCYASDHGAPWASSAFLLALVAAQRRADLVSLHEDLIYDEHLHVKQVKTGTLVRLPLGLKLDAINMTLTEVIEDCLCHGPSGKHLIRSSTGKSIVPGLLTTEFATCRNAVIPAGEWNQALPATLHEIRSLSERLYRGQAVDTQTLLGHKNRNMTDQYNDDRGLTANDWKTLQL